jgi:hypothetical protein
VWRPRGRGGGGRVWSGRWPPWGGGGGGAIEREEEDRRGVTRQGRPSDEHATGMILSTWVGHISDLMF